jgi:putative phosphoesterase
VNALSRLDPGLLGSPEALAALARADSARVLVIADTHGHYEAFEAILREYGASADALLFAGDGMWDIVQCVENALESDHDRAILPPVIAYVSGNGDGEQYRVSIPRKDDSVDHESLPGATLEVPVRQVVTICGFRILLAHGHRYSVDVSPEIIVDAAHSMACDIAVFGHTHVPFREEFAHILALNPGSPARPRGTSGPTFALLDLDATSITPNVTFVSVQGGMLGSHHFTEEGGR